MRYDRESQITRLINIQPTVSIISGSLPVASLHNSNSSMSFLNRLHSLYANTCDRFIKLLGYCNIHCWRDWAAVKSILVFRFEQTSKVSSVCSAKDAKEGKCYGGFARIATLVRQARRSSVPCLFLNAGDTYQGTIWYNVYKWKIVAKFLNLLAPDAAVRTKTFISSAPPVRIRFDRARNERRHATCAQQHCQLNYTV